jgi:hypothetical protein
VSVVFNQTIAIWSGAAPVASASFTPNAGDCIVVVGLDGNGNSKLITVSGTGTYTVETGPNNDNNGDTEVGAANTNASGTSQTVTIGSTTGDTCAGFGQDYGGVGSVSANFNLTNAPGTGSGAILGTSVTVPVNGVLIALCIDASNTTVPTSPSGTNRGSGTIPGGQAYCWTEYAGAGAAIQPSFTSSAGGTDNFVIYQFLLKPPAVNNPASLSTLGAGA